MKNVFLLLTILLTTTSCVTVNQYEVGVRRVFGRLDKQTLKPGLHGINIFSTQVLKLPIYTQNIEISLALPSREGLSVRATISILYSINPKMAHEVLRRSGKRYQRDLILSIFRSASSDICAKYPAKDMHSGKRSVIEKAIKTRMSEELRKRGFLVEAVLMKNIRLPRRLASSIEARLAAEQDALRMRYILIREKQEAQRKKIAAIGARDAQKILSQGLTNKLLRLRAIKAFEKLAKSGNSKIIIVNGPTSASPKLTLPVMRKKKKKDD